MKLSTMSKAIMGMLATIAGAIAATFPETALGKVCVVVAAALTALVAVYLTKNTEVATPGKVLAVTGTAVGAAVAGTTGTVGAVLDATVGKLIPGSGG